MTQNKDRDEKKGSELTFILLAAISIDGRITNGAKDGSEWTSREDRLFFKRELDRADAVITGRKTFVAIKRPFTPRNRIVFTRDTTSLQTPVCKDVVLFNGSGRKLCKLLTERCWKRIAVVGGTSIYDWFLKRNLVDEVWLTVEPVIFGKGKMLTGQLQKPIRDFELLSCRRLNARGTLLLHYKSKS